MNHPCPPLRCRLGRLVPSRPKLAAAPQVRDDICTALLGPEPARRSGKGWQEGGEDSAITIVKSSDLRSEPRVLRTYQKVGAGPGRASCQAWYAPRCRACDSCPDIAAIPPFQRNIPNPVFGLKHAERLLKEAAIARI